MGYIMVATSTSSVYADTKQVQYVILFYSNLQNLYIEIYIVYRIIL